jgi:hypothetical protein
MKTHITFTGFGNSKTRWQFVIKGWKNHLFSNRYSTFWATLNNSELPNLMDIFLSINYSIVVIKSDTKNINFDTTNIIEFLLLKWSNKQ